MIPHKLRDLMQANGTLHTYTADEVFHTQNFGDTLFLLKTGYVKRYQVATEGPNVIELIYGPGQIFPLSQFYKRIFGIEQNQTNLVYVYQTMTDIEIFSMEVSDVLDRAQKDNSLFIDLYYEGGVRLTSNIQRLASNALKDDYKKVAHQFISLANEYGDAMQLNGQEVTKICVPLRPVDMAEQINIATNVAESIIDNLVSRGLLIIENNYVHIVDADALKDIYL